uniref:non-specific serine/threonine protein kinase n=1 Tax=Vernicia montana TaxID=316732 RepID=A0A140G4H4_9ROSI|nr:LRR-RLK [Vernicia montana]
MHRLNIAIDIASAIEYLHNGCPSTIIHGDLKPSNVLLDDEMTAHVGDFGLAKIVSTISSGAEQHRSSSLAIKGTIGYVPPEYGMSDMVSIEGDIYSYGILLLEMFTGKKPTNNSFIDELNLHIFVERSLPYEVMEIVDPSIQSEDGIGNLVDGLASVLRIGVACSKELPTERMKMVDAIRGLQKVKDMYKNELRK